MGATNHTGTRRTVPNQRTIIVYKSPTNKQNLYATLNLSALDEAASQIKSEGGFRLYIYLAKNQNNYNFVLSSSHFQQWSGCGKTAYTTGFNELVEKGYLVPNPKVKNGFIFHDKAGIAADEAAEKNQFKVDYSTAGFNF